VVTSNKRKRTLKLSGRKEEGVGDLEKGEGKKK